MADRPGACRAQLQPAPRRDHAGAATGPIEARNAAHDVGDGVLECRALNNLLTVVSPHSQVGAWARAELADAAKTHGIDRLGAVMLTLWEAEAALAAGDMRKLRVMIGEAGEHWPAGTKEHGFYLSVFADLLIEEGRVVEALSVATEMLELELIRLPRVTRSAAGTDRRRHVDW